MKNTFYLGIALSLLIITELSHCSLLNDSKDSLEVKARKNKKLNEMGNIMFKALQSVLIENKTKELSSLLPKERNLVDISTSKSKKPRELRGNKLTKKIQSMIRDKYKSKIYNRTHKFATSRLLNNHNSQEPIFKPVYISSYPRIMTLMSTASNITNMSEKVMGEDAFDSDKVDLKEIFSAAHSGLKMYEEIRNFIKILYYEQAELSLEIDSFFYNCDKILISKDEMLRLLSLEKYYIHAKKKCDVKSERFRELDNQLLFESNDFVDKIRRFLLAIDNLRNAGSFISFESNKAPAVHQNWEIMNTLEKVENGKQLTEVILTMKVKLESMISGIGDGVKKGKSIKSDVVKVLKEMFEIIPLVNENVSRISNLLFLMGLLIIFLKQDD